MTDYDRIDSVANQIVDVLHKNAVLDDVQQAQVLVHMIKYGCLPVETERAIACYIDLSDLDPSDIRSIGRVAYMLHASPKPIRKASPA